jgi:hypothetical protein
LVGKQSCTPEQWYKDIVSELSLWFKLLGKFNLKSWGKKQKKFHPRLSDFISEGLMNNFSQDKIIIFTDKIDILSLNFSLDEEESRLIKSKNITVY